jgi:hypothetical protein
MTCLTAPTNANGGTVVVQLCDGSTSQLWTQNSQTIVVYGSMWVGAHFTIPPHFILEAD